MQKKLILLLILVAFAIGLAAPARPVAAAGDGTNHIYFSATSYDVCWQGYPTFADPRCNYGQVTQLPNGKMFLKGWFDIVQFTAEDPRWTAECKFTADPWPPGGPNAAPLMGSFVCTPTDPALQGGWWEGTLTQVAQPGKFIAEWRAKGFGAFDGLLAFQRNTVSNHYEDEIIELPGYQP